MKALALAVLLLAGAGCKAKEHHAKQKPVPSMTAVEVQRGQDACKTYVDRICACAGTKPDLAQQCQLAKALPDAISLSLATAQNPESKPDVVEQSYASAKKVIAECIDETAKLPGLGCN